MALNYINNSHGFAFLYDITDKNSYKNITKWINIALEKNNNSKFNFLIGNKSDKENERQVPQNEAEQFAKEKNLFFWKPLLEMMKLLKNFFFILPKLIKYYRNNKYEEEDIIHLTSNKTEELETKRPS